MHNEVRTCLKTQQHKPTARSNVRHKVGVTNLKA